MQPKEICLCSQCKQVLGAKQENQLSFEVVFHFILYFKIYFTVVRTLKRTFTFLTNLSVQYSTVASRYNVV